VKWRKFSALERNDEKGMRNEENGMRNVSACSVAKVYGTKWRKLSASERNEE
jgi:hypothetical protein